VVSPEAELLSRNHQAAQDRNAAVVVAGVIRLWQALVRTDDLDGSAMRWIERIIPTIRTRYRESARLALAYIQVYRRLELGADDPGPTIQLPELPEEAVRTSLRVTGPVALKQKFRAAEVDRARARRLDVPEQPFSLQKAMDDAAREAAGAALRHTFAGGREVGMRHVAADRVALGWARQTKARPCYFCAMLASRGAVFKDDSFDESNARFVGEGDYKAHDHCRCTLRPVYRREDSMDSDAQVFEDIWARSTRGTGGRDAINAFRRAYEAEYGGRDTTTR